jgi:hypothetical protein
MSPFDPTDASANWPDRQREWRKALGRIKIGVEPIPEQVERLRLVSLVMTVVSGGIGAIFIALFTAFRHPWIGLTVAGVIVGPVIASSWIGFARLKARADRYLREKEEVDRLRGSGLTTQG